MSDKYDDIINLPHHVSQKHKQMPLSDRAAQFAPFAALTGYGDAVEETARVTDVQTDISDDEIMLLDAKLRSLAEQENQHPEICVTYFKHDEKKSGGEYITVRGSLKKIDDFEKVLVLSDKTRIEFGDIVNIEYEK